MHHDRAQKFNLKQKVIGEVRRLISIFIYLSVFFSVFRLYTRLILSEYEIDYTEFGLTLLKALVLSKIILTADLLRLGQRFRNWPLAVPTVYNTIVFAVFAFVLEVIEHFATEGIFHGKTPVQVWHEVEEIGWPHYAAMTLVVFIAFIPFFAFRELERVLGEGAVRDLFIKRLPPPDNREPMAG